MKHTGKRIATMVLVGMLIGSLFTACGSGSWMSEDYESSVFPTDPGDGYSDALVSGSEVDTVVSEDVRSDRKIIENIDMSVETKAFDALLDRIEEQVQLLGGYVESASVSGNSYEGHGYRSADMVVRIPAENSDAFSEDITANSVVVHRSVDTEDITLQYVDIESRLAALKAERQALEALLAVAASTDEILSIREQLVEVIADIESYTAQLRTFDNLVDYATFTLYIYEVEQTTVVEKQTVWQRIGTNLKNNFRHVGNGLTELFVFLVSAVPFVLPIAAVIVLIVWIVRRTKRRKQDGEK